MIAAPPRRRGRPWPAALALALGVLLLSAGSARAHGVGMSQLQLSVDGPRIDGTWSLHLRDARWALGLDPSLEGEAGWADFKAHEREYRELLGRSLVLRANSAPTVFTITPAPLEWDPTMSQVRVHVAFQSPVAPDSVWMHCELMFDKDPTHRAYFSVEDARATNVGAFHADQRTASFRIRQFRLGEVVLEFIRDGIGHIWTGPDHMLFLLALLLPAALVRERNGWTPRAGLWPSSREVLKVVTAFTLAHTATLCLSFFGVLRFPSQWVEVGIALSVFAAAWNNLRPFLPGRAWAMAMSFGLVHGMGFAGALGNLSLPRNARLLALGAFNAGVEVGQLAIVAVALPLLYLGSRRNWYPRLVMGAGSLGIAWLAVIWVLQRGFTLQFFAHHP